MNPQQALELLTVVTEQLSLDLRVQMATNDGRQLTLTGNSRALHRSVGEALRVIAELAEAAGKTGQLVAAEEKKHE